VAADLDFYVEADVQGLPARGISESTCQFFGVRVGKLGGKTQHLYPYTKDGQVVAVKARGADKEFKFLGDAKHPTMFGQQLWEKGKKIVVTEGEIDALTVAQLQNCKWPVVSVPNGAQGAKKDMARQMEFFEQFEEVVLMFDCDEPGQDAAKACAELFPPGRCKIATLPLKDPNDCLKAGKGAEVLQAIWNAKAYRPDGIVGVADVLESIGRKVEQGLPWFLPTLTELTYGRRYGELYGLGAASGAGKTDFMLQQIAYDVQELKQKVGIIFLEQAPQETVVRLAGKIAGKRFHIDDGSWTLEERLEAAKSLEGSVYMYDSFGHCEWDTIAAKIRYLVHAEGVRIVYLDHLTALADPSDERGSLEQIMKDLAGMANELKIILTYVSHLTTPESGSHENGAQVHAKHFKGSRSIIFWSFGMFALERNQQAEDIEERTTTTLRILKDRFSGQATGHTLDLGYDTKTGRLYEKDSFVPEADPEAYTF
jgi:twinkle protein